MLAVLGIVAVLDSQKNRNLYIKEQHKNIELKEENTTLSDENVELNNENVELNKNIVELNEQIENLKQSSHRTTKSMKVVRNFRSHGLLSLL